MFLFVSFKQMILMTEEFEKHSPRIYFPLSFFIRSMLTLYFFAFGVGLFWYNILASVSMFLLLCLLFYVFLFSSVWKVFDLSVGRFAIFLAFTVPVATAVGFLAQKAFAVVINLFRLLLVLLSCSAAFPPPYKAEFKQA